MLPFPQGPTPERPSPASWDPRSHLEATCELQHACGYPSAPGAPTMAVTGGLSAALVNYHRETPCPASNSPVNMAPQASCFSSQFPEKGQRAAKLNSPISSRPVPDCPSLLLFSPPCTSLSRAQCVFMAPLLRRCKPPGRCTTRGHGPLHRSARQVPPRPGPPRSLQLPLCTLTLWSPSITVAHSSCHFRG